MATLPARKDPAFLRECDELRGQVMRFLAKYGISRRRLGIRVFNNSEGITQFLAGRVPQRKSVDKIRMIMAAWEWELREAAVAIIAWQGFIEVDSAGEPVELPPERKPSEFRRLVRGKLIVPSGDGMFGVPSQTYTLAPELVG